MVTVYITKWVIARGIIVGKGESRRLVAQGRRQLYEVRIRGSRNYLPWMTLGQDVFLTLKEAQVNAEKKFQRHLKDCQDAMEAALEGVVLLGQGKLLVHKDPEDILAIHAFGRPLLPRDG